MSKPISRRTLLKGIGTMMALPAMEAMLPASAFASQAAKAAKVNRMAFIFVPNGVNMDHWRPGAAGALGELPTILKPLEPVKGSLNVMSGLAQDWAHAHGDGPGDHARSAAAWLTGVKPLKTAGADIHCGTSVDQYAARELEKVTRFGSLEIGCEGGALAGDCDSGYSCAYSSTISWKTDTQPLAKEVRPRAVFERLFGSGDAMEEAQSRARREMRRASVLDFVLEDAASLRGKLGTRDQQKLDEYFTSIREIEQRLAKMESSQAQEVLAGAQMPPTGLPRDRGEHIRLMGDMMILAFQADLTRVATFMFANEGSNRPYREINVVDGHHDISHHGGDPAKLEYKRQIDVFHAEQLAYILTKMQSIQEPTGTLLDNSMIVYGGGISDGNRHNHNDLPILLAGGGAGYLKGGRHNVVAANTPMSNMFLNMLDWMNIPMDHLGDSTGRLQGVF
jgi:hypothetical protein